MSSIEIVQPGTPTSLRSLLRYWPIATFFALAMMMNPVFYLILNAIESPYLQFVFSGMVLGELVLVGLIGGLFGRHWLVGYLIGLLVALAGLMVIWHVTDYRLGAFRQLPWFWRACHVPATLLVASLPLLALRNFRHWRISHSGASKSPLRLEDIFLVTSIIGCVVVLLVAPTKLSEARSMMASRFDNIYDSSRLIVDELSFGGWGALCLLVTAPLAFLILDRNKRLSERFLKGLMHSVTVVGLGIVVVYFLYREVDSLPHFSIGFAVSYIVVLLGLICVRTSGFQLHGLYGRSLHHERLSSEPSTASPESNTPSRNVVEQHTSATANSHGNAVWLPRITTLALLGFAVYVSVVAQRLQRRAKEAVQRFSEVKADFLAKGGSIDGTTHRTASACIFGRDMGDAELNSIADCQFLDFLSLAGSKSTDAGVELVAGFQAIRDIDLSGTAITDSTLDRISQTHGRLRYVNFSNTKITMEGVNRFVKSVRTLQLSLCDNGFTDADIANFEGNPRTMINLQGNPITQASLPRLSQYRGLGLGRNNLGSKWIDALTKIPEVLMLSGSDIDDAVCAELAGKVKFIDRLKIENTAISDEGMASLKDVAINTLELGPGKITDAGLVKSGIRVAYQLKLSGPFTGACLKDWKLDTLEAVDLSNSQVDDLVLGTLPIPPTLQRFAVCNTKVSDEGLQRLQRKQMDIVALSDTKVSDQYILGSNFRMILVEPGRFNTEQIQLAQKRNIGVTPVVQEVRLLDDQRQENRAVIMANASGPSIE